MNMSGSTDVSIFSIVDFLPVTPSQLATTIVMSSLFLRLCEYPLPWHRVGRLTIGVEVADGPQRSGVRGVGLGEV